MCRSISDDLELYEEIEAPPCKCRRHGSTGITFLAFLVFAGAGVVLATKLGWRIGLVSALAGMTSATLRAALARISHAMPVRRRSHARVGLDGLVLGHSEPAIPLGHFSLTRVAPSRLAFDERFDPSAPPPFFLRRRELRGSPHAIERALSIWTRRANDTDRAPPGLAISASESIDESLALPRAIRSGGYRAHAISRPELFALLSSGGTSPNARLGALAALGKAQSDQERAQLYEIAASLASLPLGGATRAAACSETDEGVDEAVFAALRGETPVTCGG